MRRGKFIVASASAGAVGSLGLPGLAKAGTVCITNCGGPGQYQGPTLTNPAAMQQAMSVIMNAYFNQYLDQINYMMGRHPPTPQHLAGATYQATQFAIAANTFAGRVVVPGYPIYPMSAVPQWAAAFVQVASAYNNAFHPVALIGQRSLVTSPRQQYVNSPMRIFPSPATSAQDLLTIAEATGAMGFTMAIILATVFAAPEILAVGIVAAAVVGIGSALIAAAYNLPASDLLQAMTKVDYTKVAITGGSTARVLV